MLCSHCGKEAFGTQHEHKSASDTVPKNWYSRYYSYNDSVYACSKQCFTKAKRRKDMAKNYEMDTSMFIDIWARAVSDGADMQSVLMQLKTHFDNEKVNKGREFKESSAIAKMRGINKKLSTLDHNKARIPMPKTASKRISWEDKVMSLLDDGLAARIVEENYEND